MKKFIAIYLGSESEEPMEKWKALDEKSKSARENEGKAVWGNWVMKNKNSIIDQGSPLGKTKRVNAQGISNIKNRMAAYTIVQAESHDEAAKIFLSHPHFMIFPGDSIEIMECLPMPQA